MVAVGLLLTPFDVYLEGEGASDVKHEWINGLVYAMSRGHPEHGRLSAALVRDAPQTEACRVYSSDTLIISKRWNAPRSRCGIVCGAILTKGQRIRTGKSIGEAITNPAS